MVIFISFINLGIHVYDRVMTVRSPSLDFHGCVWNFWLFPCDMKSTVQRLVTIYTTVIFCSVDNKFGIGNAGYSCISSCLLDLFTRGRAVITWYNKQKYGCWWKIRLCICRALDQSECEIGDRWRISMFTGVLRLRILVVAVRKAICPIELIRI